ncbi:hypothetical protein NQZ68_020558 [Dissostichus eleginoides]|nr:hypothetical protein NQZ68_020558 [Dissostichus eleginoides]
MGGCSPTTPLKCVNEKERGQEESARSTTEVLTEGIEGLRLHLFRPSSLPAGSRLGLSLLLASVMGARASPTSSARSTSYLLVEERRETLEAPSADALLCLCGPPGEGGCWASATLPQGSHSGRPQRGTSHVTCQLARLFSTSGGGGRQSRGERFGLDEAKQHPEVAAQGLLLLEKLFVPGERAYRHSGTLVELLSGSTTSQSAGFLHASSITGLPVLREPPGSSRSPPLSL